MKTAAEQEKKKTTEHNLSFALGAGSSGVLTVNLTALEKNYQVLQAYAPNATVAAVVKANAYGLGVKKIVPALFRAGCRCFFVAQLPEAIAVWETLLNLSKQADRVDEKVDLSDVKIAILNGVQQEEMALTAEYGFWPVLNALTEIQDWAQQAKIRGIKLPAILQIDSGMARLGLDEQEVEKFITSPDLCQALDIKAILSHLACADDEKNTMNGRQEAEFLTGVKKIINYLKYKPLLSLSASGGIALGREYYFDIIRPGLALYGVVDGGVCAQNLQQKLSPVVQLSGAVLRIGKLDKGKTVGYGASYKALNNLKTATIATGYADGWPRSLSNKGAVFFKGFKLPIIGRISMDCMVVDITALPENVTLERGDSVELIGTHQTLHDVARNADTIAYEILTGLGHRFKRNYI